MNLVKLGNVNQTVWQGRSLFDQSPTATELSANNLTASGGKTTDTYSIPAAGLSAFMAAKLAGGSVVDKVLVTVNAARTGADLYSVTVETQPLEYQPEAGTTGGGGGGGGGSSTPTPEQESAMEEKYGTESQPRTLSITTQEVSVDVLRTPNYVNLSDVQKAAIKMYINGASPLTKTYLDGNPRTLQNIISQSSQLVQYAIANPVVKVLNLTIEYGFWLLSYKNYNEQFPREASPPFGRILPSGYTTYMLNGTATPVEWGYQHKEVYLCGYPEFDVGTGNS